MAKNKNVKFMGVFDNKYIAKIFSDIDVLVCPSIWYENSPLVIHEAFIANIPLIVSNIGGMRELIKNEIEGLLFQAGNYKDLLIKINMFISNTKLLDLYKKNIKLRYVKNIGELCREMEDAYSNVLIKER